MVGDYGDLGMAGAFRVVEISFRVGLQAHRKLMEMLGHLVVAVEAANVIDFAIVIQIMQFCDLVAATYVDRAVDNFHTERLKKACGDALPAVLSEVPAEPIDDPYIAEPCRHGGALAILEKVESTEAHPTVPRATLTSWQLDLIDFEGFALGSHLSRRFDNFRPSFFSAAFERC